jgi:2-keto-3-deoxy-L-fuconate dehydrogenase
MDFSGKRVLLTGAAGGIGKAVKKLFEDSGGLVALADKDLSQFQSGLKLEGDLSDPGYASNLALEAVRALGGLDIIVNNAGIMRRGLVTNSTDEDLRLSLAVNVEAPFRIARAAIPIMAQAGGGSIVNIASCWGVHPGPKHALYCMTKAAVASLTQCMGMDHAHQNIRINAVCPNEVNTPMLRSGFETRGLNPDTAIMELNQSVPLGRIAEPEDIAEVVLFLASDRARYICGELIEVNGGKPVS